MPIIVGVPRSGTTLLRMMIDAHPDVAVPPETGFLPALADLNPAVDAAPEAWRIITSFDTWPDFALDAAALRLALNALSPVSSADAARTFYRLYAARFGKGRWGDKTPTYSEELPRLAALLPEARFVHIIRDGRDVFLSVRQLWFRPGESVEACAGDWAARLERTRALGLLVPHYLEIQYEALVDRTEPTLREICRFLDLAFDPAMLDYHHRAAARLGEHQGRCAADGQVLVPRSQRLHHQRLVMSPPRTDRIGQWKTAMSEDEIARFQAVAGVWLERSGYRLKSP